MLPKPHVQLQHSDVKHTQRVDYHSSDCSEEAVQHCTFAGFIRSSVSRISSDILDCADCLDTALDDLIVLAHAVIGEVQLYKMFSSHKVPEMINPCPVSGGIDDLSGDFIQALSHGFLLGTVFRKETISSISQIVLPLLFHHLPRSIALSLLPWSTDARAAEFRARTELLLGGGRAEFFPVRSRVPRS